MINSHVLPPIELVMNTAKAAEVSVSTALLGGEGFDSSTHSGQLLPFYRFELMEHTCLGVQPS